MSASEDANRQALLELEEKIIKIANLHADTALKEVQTRTEPWKLVVSGVAAGGALVGAVAVATAFIVRGLSH